MIKDLQAPFIQRQTKAYNTDLASMSWARRARNKNNEIYYVVRFSSKHIYHIIPNDYYEETLKSFNTMWDDNVVMTKEVKSYRKRYRSIHSIPRYNLWQVGMKTDSYHKVSWINVHKDINGNPYYFIPKTRVIPFKTDTRFLLKKDYYIFHDDINNNGTLKNKARLWYAIKPWAFKP